MIYDIKKDLKHFKETTTGGICIMGRKTYDSMGRALPNRENIILSRDEDLKIDGALVFNSVDDIIKYCKNSQKQAFVIGGGQIVDLFLPYADEAIITKIDRCDPADTFLHNFDKDSDFEIIDESETMTDNGIDFKFVRYRRVK